LGRPDNEPIATDEIIVGTGAVLNIAHNITESACGPTIAPDEVVIAKATTIPANRELRCSTPRRRIRLPSSFSHALNRNLLLRRKLVLHNVATYAAKESVYGSAGSSCAGYQFLLASGCYQAIGAAGGIKGSKAAS
jgi:hypothetical protein